MDDRSHTVLCVDDEKNILNSLHRLLRREDYALHTATSGAEGLRILSEREVHVVLSDQRMPEMSGVEFLTRVKESYPEIIRIILSGYTDLDSITEAVNKGHIYKFLLKPWDDPNLKLEIRQALQQYDLIKDNKRLHQQVLRQNEELTSINQNLEEMIVARTRELELKNQALELSHAILEDVPLPIVGVSAEGTIAFINRRTQQLTSSGVCIRLGHQMSDVFPNHVSHVVELVISGNDPGRIDGVVLGQAAYDLQIHPLSGRFNRMGAIITLEQVTLSPAESSDEIHLPCTRLERNAS